MNESVVDLSEVKIFGTKEKIMVSCLVNTSEYLITKNFSYCLTLFEFSQTDSTLENVNCVWQASVLQTS